MLFSPHLFEAASPQEPPNEFQILRTFDDEVGVLQGD